MSAPALSGVRQQEEDYQSGCGQSYMGGNERAHISDEKEEMIRTIFCGDLRTS